MLLEENKHIRKILSLKQNAILFLQDRVIQEKCFKWFISRDVWMDILAVVNYEGLVNPNIDNPKIFGVHVEFVENKKDYLKLVYDFEEE